MTTQYQINEPSLQIAVGLSPRSVLVAIIQDINNLGDREIIENLIDYFRQLSSNIVSFKVSVIIPANLKMLDQFDILVPLKGDYFGDKIALVFPFERYVNRSWIKIRKKSSHLNIIQSNNIYAGTVSIYSPNNFFINGNRVATTMLCAVKDFKGLDTQLGDDLVVVKNNSYFIGINPFESFFPSNDSTKRLLMEELHMNISYGNYFLVQLIYGLIGIKL